MDHKGKERLDLSRLRARLPEKPRTKAGQVRQAWPDIKALFAAGHSLKDIWAWLNEIGIEIGYARLSHYLGQLRRRDEAVNSSEMDRKQVEVRPEHSVSDLPARVTAEPSSNPSVGQQPRQGDPLANLIERERRGSGFDYNSEPDSKKLI